jgi:Lamin-B receptor of TUDOR domain
MKQSTLSTFFKSALSQSATPVENGSSLINFEVNQNLDSIQSTQPNKEIEIEESLLTFPIGTKIMKPFPPDNQYYGGEIVEYDEMEKWYKVIYDDGDVEDLDHYEVLKYLKANQDSFSKKNNSIPQKRRNKSIDCSNNRKECHSVNSRITKTRQSSSLEKLENLSDNESVSKMTSSGKRGRSKNVSFAKFYDSESSSKLEDWDDDSFDDNCQILSKESSGHQNKRSRLLAPSKSSHVATLGIMNGRKNTKATTKPVQSSSKSTSKSESKLPKKGSDSKVQGSTEKKKMSECFEPKNYPDYQKLSLKQIKEEKEFLDPCGMEATDGIIDRLVGEQVDKIGSLLARSLSSDLGSLATSLKLGTACSGTDAPALALTLIKEQMELRKLQPLNFVHCFSCEVDPFKQGKL